MKHTKALSLVVAASAFATGTVANASLASAAPAPKIVAVVQGLSSSGGYVLYSNGMLNAQKGAPFYGDARKSGQNNFAGIAQTFGGYWLINSTGKVFQFGNGCFIGNPVGPSKIVGPIVGAIGFGTSESGNGFYEVNSAGKLFRFACE